MTAEPLDLEASVPARFADRLIDLSTCLTLQRLPGRDLDQRELAELAAGLAAQPHRWQQHLVPADDTAAGARPGERYYVSLHRDAHVDVWLLCWQPEDDTGWHDHDVSSGAVAVATGTLVEHNLAIGRPFIATSVPAGSVYSFGPDHIHRLVGAEPGSVSVHAYSPPLWRMGRYSIRGGVLRRVSVSYADELRPLDDMA